MILWDVNTGAEIRRFNGHPAGIFAVAFSSDGRTAASAGWQNTLILWHVATGAEIRRFKDYQSGDQTGFLDGLSWVGFSPDGRTLASTWKNIRLWDVRTGQEIRHLDGHAANVHSFMFSSDGRQAFSGGNDGTAILWNVASGSIIYRLTDHSGPVAHVDISDDAQLGIGASTDGTTILWDLQKGKMIRRYAANPFMALFSPDKRTALIRELPDHVELWRIDATLDALLTWTRANRYIPELTCEQRTLYRLEPLCGKNATQVPPGTG